MDSYHVMRICLLALFVDISPVLASPPSKVFANGATAISAPLAGTKVVASIQSATTHGHSLYICSWGALFVLPWKNLN